MHFDPDLNSETQNKPDNAESALQPARIYWNSDNTPCSEAFDDVYYCNQNGLEESRYVFLQHNHLPERWEHLAQKQACFTIMETGFGTGLNFLATLKEWHSTDAKPQHLHFVSIEKHPIPAAQLQKALTPWATLGLDSDALITKYPPLLPGIHRLEFPQYNTTLTLIFDDVNNALASLKRQDTWTVDAWFLDGFAPSKNASMWQTSLYAGMQALSHKGTTVATFTAAGSVRRGLQAYGFDTKKVAGFGRKRDMLVAQLVTPAPAPSHLPVQHKPWFRGSQTATLNSQTADLALVIGAGLAGAATAYGLARRGIRVVVLEKNAEIAQEASGNPSGITFTKLSPIDSPQNRFYQRAYLYACSQIDGVMQAGGALPTIDYHLNGVIRLAYSEQESCAQQQLFNTSTWPESVATPLSVNDTEKRLNRPSPHSSVLLPQGGWVKPAVLCAAYLGHPNITVVTGTRVTQLKPTTNAQWHIDYIDDHNIRGKNDPTPPPLPASYSHVVIANSFDAAQLMDLDYLPLKSIRGQITYVDSTQPPESSGTELHYALNYKGYMTPPMAYTDAEQPGTPRWRYCIGATFDPKSKETELRREDQETNLENLQVALPHLANALRKESSALQESDADTLLPGRVAFRCQTTDYLPIIGPVPRKAECCADYTDIRAGFLKRPQPTASYYPGLFINIGHGSRGITSSILGADIIASHITGAPPPVDSDVLEAIHPIRFIIRGLKRGQL